jgi:mannitol/fructose-specific phosphotransferase system IIA component (Ntr-type)
VYPNASEPVTVFLLFIAPAENMKLHLAFLATVSYIFQRKSTVESLLASKDPVSALAAIKQAETDR